MQNLTLYLPFTFLEKSEGGKEKRSSAKSLQCSPITKCYQLSLDSRSYPTKAPNISSAILSRARTQATDIVNGNFNIGAQMDAGSVTAAERMSSQQLSLKNLSMMKILQAPMERQNMLFRQL